MSFFFFRVCTRKLHYKKQLCTVQYTTASEGEGVSIGANAASDFFREGKQKAWRDPGAVGKKCGQVKASWLG